MFAPDKKSQFDDYIIPAGSYPARLYLMVDLGHQYAKFQDRPGKWMHKIRLGWEIPELTFEAEDKETGEKTTKPRVIGKEYTLSYYKESHLKTDIQSWIGRALTADEQDKGYALDALMGAPCMISVVHADGHDKDGQPRTYANVASVMACPRSVTVPELFNPYMLYDMTNDPDNKVFDSLYPWLKERIKKAQEFQHEDGDMEAEPTADELADTSVPFDMAPIPEETFANGNQTFTRAEWISGLRTTAKAAGMDEPDDMEHMKFADLQAAGNVIIKRYHDMTAKGKKVTA